MEPGARPDDGIRTCAACGEENPERARYCLGCGRPLVAASIAESRRAVTILFSDLVSSTALAERLDVETNHRVVGRFYESAREAVQRHGGTVEKFVGDALMAVFGYPRVHEDDALRAALAALELRRALDAVNATLERDWGVRLDTRTGIATGEVLAGHAGPEEPFVSGSAVNLAARLEQHAAPGETLLDEATAHRIARRVEAVPVEPLELKGFEGGVPAYRLVGLLAHGGDATARTAIMDRVSELRLLAETFRGVVDARRCRVANVVGDAGVGKTRLVREFTESVDARVLRGRCPAYGEEATFRALAEVVTGAVGATPDAATGSLMDALVAITGDRLQAARTLAAVDLSGDAIAAEERASTMRAFLGELAQSGPLAVVIDDLHHASQALLDVLQHLVEWTRDAPILLACAGRPELFFDHPSWGRLPGRLTLHLEPLADDDGASLVRGLLPGVSAEVERRIVDIADGNPFFIEEIAASLGGAAGELEPADVPVPPSVTALLEARVDRISDDERRVLERAAVLGLAFRERELVDLAGEDVPAVLARLTERDLVLPDPAVGAGGWRFRHALIRDTAYGVIPKQTRARLHAAVAEHLADDVRAGSHLERAARALQELGSRGPEVRRVTVAAAERLAAAGRTASRRGDVGSAVSLLDRASALFPHDEPGRLPVLADLHHALLYAGEIERAEAVIGELVAAFAPEDDDLLAVRARMQAAHLRFLVDPAALPQAAFRDLLHAAAHRFEDAGDARNLAAALTDLALIDWLQGRAGDMAETAERALVAAERSDDPRAIQEAAPLLAGALLRGPTPLDEVLARVAAVRRRVGDDRLTGAILQLTEASSLAMVDRDADARRILADARATFRDLGQRRWLAATDQVEADVERRAGDLVRADRARPRRPRLLPGAGRRPERAPRGDRPGRPPARGRADRRGGPARQAGRGAGRRR